MKSRENCNKDTETQASQKFWLGCSQKVKKPKHKLDVV